MITPHFSAFPALCTKAAQDAPGPVLPQHRVLRLQKQWLRARVGANQVASLKMNLCRFYKHSKLFIYEEECGPIFFRKSSKNGFIDRARALGHRS